LACNGASTGSATVTAGGGTPGYTYLWTGGATTVTASGLAAGSYTVTVTDANGCTQTASATITQPTAVTANITATTNVGCNGASTGSATVTAGGGTPGYTYLWTGGATTATASGLAAGSYTVTVTDVNGCTQTATATITQPTPLTTTASGNNVTCNAACNGNATANPSGGTAPYTYSWNDPGFQTTQTTSSTLCAGTFTVVVTDANGCTATASQVITQPVAMTLTMSSVDASCGGSDGSASVVVGGGTPGYTYLWSSGGSAATENLIPAGSYTVTVTDANGCTASNTVPVNDGGAPTVTIDASTNVTCNGACNGTATASAVGGTAPYTFAWSSGGNTASETGICAGTVSVTVTDVFGCVSTDNVIIAQPTVLNASITSTTHVLCNGASTGSATVSASGGTAAYGYLWPSGGTGATESGLAAGSYTVTVTDANSCTITATATINQPTALAASTTGTNALCNGSCDGSANLTVSGGTPAYLYNWSSSESTEDISGLCAGAYTVTVTDANGCTITSGFTVNEPTTVTASISSSTDVSIFGGSDGSATVSASNGTPGYTYDWSPNGFTGDGTVTYSALPSGTYSVTVTDANGCTAVTSVTINEPGAIVLSTTQVNLLCNGVCIGEASVSVVSGGVAPFSYLWSSGGNTANVTGLCAGVHTVTVTDFNGAFATTTVTITQPTLLTSAISSTNNVDCNGAATGSATVTPSNGTPGYTYLWPSGAITATETGLAAGSYTVTVTDANLCVTIATATISEPTVLTASIIGADALCNTSCDGSANLSVNGGTPGYFYNWSTGESLEDVSSLCAGNYIVTVSDSEGCTVTANVTINQPSAITATSSSVNSNCGQADGSATINPSGGTAGYSYDWAPNGYTNDGTATYSDLPSGTYSVTITDANSCTLVQSVTVNDASGGSANISAFTNVSCNGGSNGSATVNPVGGTPGYTYAWSSGGSNATENGLSDGIYTVTVTDAVGCNATTSVTITEPSLLTASITATIDVDCNGASTGSATVTAADGTPGYTYLWPSGGTNATESGLAAGSYIVTVYDANLCTANATAIISEPAVLTASITASTNILCFGNNDGTATVTPVGGTPGYTYVWNGGLAPTSQNNSGIAAGLINVTVTDANGCTATTSTTLTQPTDLVLNLSAVDESCGAYDGEVSVIASGGTVSGDYNYVWNDVSSSTTSIVINLGAGTYCVTVTDDNSCVETGCVSVVNQASGSITLSSTNVLCNGACNGTASVAVAGGNPPFTYLWSDPLNQITPTATNLCPGLYTVSVTDDLGCLVKDTISIYQPSILTNTISSNNPLCNGGCNGSVSVSAFGGTAGYSYLWNNGQTNSTATNLCSGSFTVTITDSNGCTLTANSTLTDPPAITVSGVITHANCGQPDGGVDITVSNGTAPYSFVWSNGANTQDLINVVAGTYCVTITDVNGCSVSDCYNINDLSGPVASISASTNVSCNGLCNGTATASGTGGTSPYTYAWSPSGSVTQIATNLCAGVHSVIITDVNGCNASANVTITQPVALTSSITFVQPLCNGNCDGSSTVTANGGTLPYSYAWTGSGSTSNIATGLCAGPYSVTVSDFNGCTSVQSVNVTEPTFISLSTSNSPASCYGVCDGTAMVTANGGIPGYTYLWNDPSAQTSNLATGLCAGTHQVTVYDANSCAETISVTVTQPTQVNASISSYQNVLCNGACNGWADVDYSGGTAPYTFSWNNLSTSEITTNLCPGVYNVTVFDHNNCSSSASVTITQPAPLAVILTPDHEDCYQACDGAIDATVTGGTLPYNYSWTNGSVIQDITNLCVGSYCVTVTDANNCSLTQCATITGPSILDILVTGITDAHCGFADGSASISPIGGVSPFTYIWSNGSVTPVISGVTSGNYTITVTDGNGCTVSETLNISDDDGPDFDNILVTNVSCNGGNNGAVVVTSSGGTGAHTYNWSTGGTGSSISGLTFGTYTVTVTDAAGCIATGNAIITQPTVLTAIINNVVHVSCNGGTNGSASVLANGGTPGYTYLWSSGGTSSTAGGLAVGQVWVTVTDLNGCVVANTVTINQPTPVVVNMVSSTPSSCYGSDNGILQIAYSGGTPTYGILWLESGNTNSLEANLAPGDHTVCITDANGCVQCATFVTDEPDPIIVTTSTIAATCNLPNGQAQIDDITGGTIPYSVVWSPGSYTSWTVTGLDDGIYTLQVNDEHGCSQIESVQVFNIPPPESVVMSSTPASCFGYSDGTASVSVNGGQLPYTYIWSSTSTASTATGLSAGNYFVTVTDGNGCTIAGSTTVQQPSQIQVYTTGTTTICAGQFTNISANAGGGTPPYSFIWSDPSMDNSQNQSVNPTVNTTYYVTATDAFGCHSTPGSVTVSVFPDIVVAAIPTDTTICSGTPAYLFASATGGDGGPYSYVWSGLSSTSSSVIVNPLNTTTYTVFATDNCGSPSNVATIQVYVEMPPEINVLADYREGCEPLLVQFDNFTAEDDVVYSWNFGDPGSGVSNTSSIQNPVHEYVNPGNYNVSLTVSNSIGCSQSEVLNNYISVYPVPVADFYAYPEVTDMFHPRIEFFDMSVDASIWHWYFGNGNQSNVQNPVHNYTAAGTYTVMLFVSSAEGCVDSISKEIIIQEQFTFYAPTAITPGNGGRNQEFYTVGYGIDESNYHLYIYDRWGEVIFETTDYYDRWNGRFMGYGEYVEMGTYTWLVKLMDVNGTPHEFSGPITVIR
jgi:PKD repeat protein